MSRRSILKEFDLVPMDFDVIMWHKIKKLLDAISIERDECDVYFVALQESVDLINGLEVHIVNYDDVMDAMKGINEALTGVMK